MQKLFTIIGKKWALFILHSVQEGAHTFTDIRKEIGDANTKILTDRLAELVENKLLRKTENNPIMGYFYYFSLQECEAVYHFSSVLHEVNKFHQS